MARVETIVVGGGIAAGSPFQLNFVPIVGATDPATLITTDFLFTVPTGANRGLIVGTADPAAGPERLRVKGGCILEPATGATGTCIGDGADSGADGQILIGIAPVPATSTNGIAIGNAAELGATATAIAIGQGARNLGGGIVIGGSATVLLTGSLSHIVIGGTTAASGSTAVCNIGGAVSVTTGVTCVGIASTIGGSATNSTLLGNSASILAPGGIAIGSGATVNNTTFTNSIAIGNGAAAFAANQLCIGSNVSLEPINTVVIGHGANTQANPTGVTFRLTNASGTNNLAGNTTIVAGLSTGNIATGGNIVFQTGEPVGSGTTLQTATTRLTIAQAVATFTVRVVLPAGTLASPALRFTDADTGLFEQAAGNVAVAVNGVESARFSGGAAGETNFMLFDVDNATLERVSVGAADSGGVGFKLLRIPN